MRPVAADKPRSVLKVADGRGSYVAAVTAPARAILMVRAPSLAHPNIPHRISITKLVHIRRLLAHKAVTSYARRVEAHLTVLAMNR